MRKLILKERYTVVINFVLNTSGTGLDLGACKMFGLGKTRIHNRRDLVTKR